MHLYQYKPVRYYSVEERKDWMCYHHDHLKVEKKKRKKKAKRNKYGT